MRSGMMCVTSLTETTIPSYGTQIMSGSEEVNGGWEQDRGPEGNRGPEWNSGQDGNRGPDCNCEGSRLVAGDFGSWNPKFPASIRPCQYFTGSMLFFFCFQCN